MNARNRFLVICFLLYISQDVYAQFKNIKVNNVTANQPNEVSICVNPKNPNYIAIGSNLNLYYYSTNGGNSWTQKTMASSLGVWGDPCLVYDANGNLFYGHLSNPAVGGYWIDRIVVQKSTDNGVTWDSGAGVGFSPPRKNQDKEWIGVDITNSQYRNNLYMAWTEFDKYGSPDPNDHSRIMFSKSTDSGTSWSTPFKVIEIEGDCLDDDNTVEGAVPCVGPKGEVYLSWSGPKGIKFDKSMNGGITFGKDVHVANLNAGWAFDIPGIYRCNGFPVTACDISNSPYRGNIYINWSDQDNNGTDIYFSKSIDGGLTWSSPKRVNDDNTTRHQFFNWMTVDPVTGMIYIIFYDRRNSVGLETDVYIARSSDGGDSFQNFKISDSPFTPSATVFFGDYTNIAAFNGKVYPVWMRMDGGTMSIWFSVINDIDLITSVNYHGELLINEFKLIQNYPNPFNPSTIISYQLPVSSFVRIKVYDIIGNEVALLVNDFKPRGIHEIEFKSRNLSSGIYLYRMEAGNYFQSKKMILLR
ncbi:MAG: T9SS type A sorting domain-containing protein [Melioribacteraceae bacterium]|nr:T9SS type A sorting domain-containing protein [Melioribacteraceae bacterium]